MSTSKDQRRYALAISGGVCEVCGRPLNDGQPQGAHRIANTIFNRSKWGSFIVDHPDNIAMVCSLSCNHACNIGHDTGECLRLLNKIVKKELQKYK